MSEQKDTLSADSLPEDLDVLIRFYEENPRALFSPIVVQCLKELWRIRHIHEPTAVQGIGKRLWMSNNEFERRASVFIDDEQNKISPDHALIDFIYNAVRLSRENVWLKTPPAAEPLAARVDWVSCPICDEPDMRETIDGHGMKLIRCVNHACRSNGGTAGVCDATLSAIAAKLEEAKERSSRYRMRGDIIEVLMMLDEYSIPNEALESQTDENGRPITYWGGLRDKGDAL